MGTIATNIENLLRELPPEVKVVAVTKTRTAGEAMEAYNAGLRLFGENRVQELAAKKDLLPEDVIWHLIGHLQSNKVRQAVAIASMIEAVDSLKLLKKIDEEAVRQDKQIDCLLQFYIASEETKQGFGIEEADSTEWKEVAASLRGVRICGVMGMATFTDDSEQVRREFRTLALIFRNLHDRHFSGMEFFREISMGMTGDWPLAVEEGSTMVRVGTLIFGERIIR
ncbi:MAG: YggS family pyridoxal phosphate-dependent enzyme [Bacteroidales bacterium]|nr:YggS family pyridoxal phosphate-dependent enzyme [Bacteroidales bacterium]MDT8372749.1 YggS family pyridoxal phosphate-dependent enzyme [Bacteroidales bacterium]